MDGDSEPHFRDYRYDLPQDTQLFGWYLSNHHWHNGPYRVLQRVRILPQYRRRGNVKRIFCVLAAISCIFVFASCSLIGSGSPTTPGTVPSNYPESVVYKIELSNETYLCSSFNVSNTDAEVTLRLNEVYSVSSDGKITWMGKEKNISAVKIEKISK